MSRRSQVDLFEACAKCGGSPHPRLNTVPLAAQIADGQATVEGDVGLLQQLGATLVAFDPRFEIMPGTAGTATPEDLNDYEVGPYGHIAE